jgi:hypothetical protein
VIESKNEFGPVKVDARQVVELADGTTDVGELHKRSLKLGIDGVTRVGGKTFVVLAKVPE